LFLGVFRRWEISVNGLVVVVNDGCYGRMEHHRKRGDHDCGVKPVAFVNNPAHRGDGTVKQAEEEFCIFPNHGR